MFGWKRIGGNLMSKIISFIFLCILLSVANASATTTSEKFEPLVYAFAPQQFPSEIHLKGSDCKLATQAAVDFFITPFDNEKDVKGVLVQPVHCKIARNGYLEVYWQFAVWALKESGNAKIQDYINKNQDQRLMGYTIHFGRVTGFAFPNVMFTGFESRQNGLNPIYQSTTPLLVHSLADAWALQDEFKFYLNNSDLIGARSFVQRNFGPSEATAFETSLAKANYVALYLDPIYILEDGRVMNQYNYAVGGVDKVCPGVGQCF